MIIIETEPDFVLSVGLAKGSAAVCLAELDSTPLLLLFFGVFCLCGFSLARREQCVTKAALPLLAWSHTHIRTSREL